jgi:D-alanyl-D-alanine dipeptidase
MGKSLISLLIVALCGLCACDYFAHKNADTPDAGRKPVTVDVQAPVSLAGFHAPGKKIQVPLVMSSTELKMREAGLVDIRTIDTSIVVDLRYSTKNNFLGMDVYGDYDKCYLLPEVADKLECAQQILRSRFPFYRLVVFDAVRPRSVQEKMWDTINVPYSERSKYLSNPANGSLHNFGAAVDLSIRDIHGIELDMGTPYDYFGELAYPREEERMIEEGKLTHIQLLNRQLLREVMEQAGFMGITTEWWHFNSLYRSEAYQRYKIIE